MSQSRRETNLRIFLRAGEAAVMTALLVLGGLGGAYAQSAPGASASPHQTKPAIAPSNVVEMLAVVRDKKGEIVPNLSQNDFDLTVDGSAQTLDYFGKPADVPLTLGLLVDTSPGQREILDQERSASGPFFDHTVREGMDKAFLIHFDHEVELLQDLTSSPQKLGNAVSLLQVSQPPQFSRTSQGGSPGNDPDEYPGQYPGGGGRERGVGRGGTQLYDAIYLASHDLMNKESGRKALVIVSDGVDRGSKETLAYAIETAQRANTLIYCVYFKGQEQQGSEGRRHVGFGGPGMGGPMGGGGMGRRGGGRRYPEQESHVDGKKILEQISKETGGRMFEVSKKLPLDQIYDQIEGELRSEYILGFTPASGTTNVSDYHKLQLTTKKKGLTVQVREGYYSQGAL